ncbi:MAG: hypothetical protein AAF696_09850, partial [Bacteroidota bacterium]
MTIHYTQKRLKRNLIIAGLWLILGIIAIVSSSSGIFIYGYLALGVLYLGAYLFERKNQYLTIETGIISKNHLIPKKIKLAEINRIQRIAGNYILKTDAGELRINPSL